VAIFLLTPAVELPAGAVGWVGDVLRAGGAPESLVAGKRVETLMNVLVISPLTFFGHWAFPGRSWQDWTAYGFVGSMAVETTQGLYLSARSPEYVDVVANTAGALLGALATIVVAAYQAREDLTDPAQ
jgi:glycopeptide antibiotics resistance protein